MSSLAEVLAGAVMWHVEEGNALDVLRLLPEGCVQCLVSSPPYFGLRKYEGVEPAPWPEVTYTPMAGAAAVTIPAMTCCLGGEPDPLAFIGHLVLIFREAWRVMRDDGVMFVNLGDSHNSNPSWGRGKTTLQGRPQSAIPNKPPAGWLSHAKTAQLKSKDLMMVPARFALAMQADGWWLRQCVTWAKVSPMPGSQRDRPTTATEDIFLFSKAPSYFYDADACRVPCVTSSPGDPSFRSNGKSQSRVKGVAVPPGQSEHGGIDCREGTADGRNLWSWWECEPDEEGGNFPPVLWKLSTEGLGEKHYASYPSEIPRRALKLGTSAHGCCSSCLTPWRRVTERTKLKRERPNDYVKRVPTSSLTGGEYHPPGRRDTKGQQGGVVNSCANTVAGVSTVTLGWEAGCGCGREDVAPCLCLDLFCGSGTTGVVARELGLRFVGIDASPQYAAMARRRIASVAPLLDASSTQSVAPKVEQPTLFD